MVRAMNTKTNIRVGAVLLGVALAAPASGAAFTLTSADFKNNAAIADKSAADTFGCTGQNVSPALEWKNAPAETKSFALLVHDPDAPTGGSGFWHWLVYDIPATTTSLPAGAGSKGGAMPAGAVQARSDYGVAGYGGPCPPPGSGKHHYNFTLYALKVEKLDIPAGATASLAGFMVNANAIAKARFTGLYGRPKK